MKLVRMSASNPDFAKLDEMMEAMMELLQGKVDASLTMEELLTFQDDDGSFKLLDSYEVPGEARHDYCYMPTYICAAVLMKHLDKGCTTNELERALRVSLIGGLSGHGYDAERCRISALNVFIRGGLKNFLEKRYYICPDFHNLVHNILHQYNSALIQNCTTGPWGEEYGPKWQEIVEALALDERFYIAYGSNMSNVTMYGRCPGAKLIDSILIYDWKLDLPFYATIEKKEGHKTPAVLWRITKEQESKLNRCEGYPKMYDKTDIIVEMNGNSISAMAYVMTDEYKKSSRKARVGYIEEIKAGYLEAGFSLDELKY